MDKFGNMNNMGQTDDLSWVDIQYTILTCALPEKAALEAVMKPIENLSARIWHGNRFFHVIYASTHMLK